MSIRQRIKAWWRGEHLKNEPDSPLVFFGIYKRHWTSRAAHTVADFCAREWKWLLAFLVAAASVIVAALKL